MKDTILETMKDTILETSVDPSQSGIVQIKQPRRTHPLSDYKEMGNSILAWVDKFDSLYFHPKTLDELVYSFTLYTMMSEMDPVSFPMLSPKLLKIDQKNLRKDTHQLKEIYNKMLVQLELWFATNMENETIFDSEMISLKRLLGRNDRSELFFLIEFILIVAVKGA